MSSPEATALPRFPEAPMSRLLFPARVRPSRATLPALLALTLAVGACSDAAVNDPIAPLETAEGIVTGPADALKYDAPTSASSTT